jgi:hypothetical protein
MTDSNAPECEGAQVPGAKAPRAGTSKEYLLYRLEKDRHVELLAAVKAGKLSVHSAAIEANIIKRPEPLGIGSSSRRQKREWALRHSKLSHAETMSLWLGEDPYNPAFPDDDSRRAAWVENRDYLMAVCCVHPGGRPDAWWSFESPVPRPKDDAYCAAALWEVDGLLDDIERAALEAEWRRQFDKAQASDFAYCTSDPENWLKGAPARRAHYKWCGLPRALVRQWSAERRRSRRIIKKLADEAQEPPAPPVI